MKKTPDLIFLIILFFVLGTVITGVAQSGVEFANVVQNVLSD